MGRFISLSGVPFRNTVLGLALGASSLGAFAMQSAGAAASADADVQAALKTPVDSRHARIGEEVTAITRNNATLGTTRLPKGTTLIGHVTEVTAKNSTNANGSVSMLFDRARLKDGTVVPVRATLRSLAPATHVQTSGDADAGFAAPRGGAEMGADAGVSARGGNTGGGLLGGAAGATRGALGSAVGTAGDVTSGAVASVAASTRTAVGAAASGLSSIPGVSLATAADAATSGTVAAQGQNVHLDSGTQLTLGVAAR